MRSLHQPAGIPSAQRPIPPAAAAGPGVRRARQPWNCVLAICFVATSIAGCGSSGASGSPETPAQAYLALAATYDQVVTETNAQLSSGQVAGAFARLALAEHAFGTGLAAIDFPPNATNAAERLRAASVALENLYTAELHATMAPDQANLLDQIAAARASASQAAADLRRALGLPAP